jgi:hypothetical protein
MQVHAIGIGHSRCSTVAREEASDHSTSQTAHRNGRPRARARVGPHLRALHLAGYRELMGWTADGDTLATEVRLTFATRAEAVAYAERQGLE